MVTLQTTPCPVCRASLSPDARDCSACRVALTTKNGALTPNLPVIRPGALLVSHDYRAMPIPGKASRGPEGDAFMHVAPHHEGVVATFSADTTYTAHVPGPPIRDACIRGVFTPLGPGARLALMARWKPLQTAAMFYSFELSVDGASAFASCVVTSKGTSDRVALTGGIRTHVTERPIVMELLCQGATLRGLVSGRLVFELHDARFGEGAVGFRVGREPTPHAPTTSILCHSLEVAEVAP